MNGIRTRWIVISGAPCSGKTTVIDELSARGHKTVPETARLLIDEKLATGLTLEEIRADETAFQRELVQRKLELERSLNPNEIYFLDRALPDSITYYRRCGLDPAPIRALCRSFHYKLVLIFDRLPLRQDYARSENESAAAWLDRELERDYRDLKLQVERVPVLDIAARVEMVLRLSDATPI